ncbi:MAG: hypothetical protein ACYTGH_05570, partial [Planctomycetota bacterium]
MQRVFEESEHQEVFLLGANLEQPVPLHIPSALGALNYFVILRGPTGLSETLTGVRVAAKLTGLRSTDVEVAAGEGIDGMREIP